MMMLSPPCQNERPGLLLTHMRRRVCGVLSSPPRRAAASPMLLFSSGRHTIEGGAQECADVQGICSHKKNFRQMFLVKRHNQGRKEERVANEVKDGRLVLLSKLLLLMPCDKVAIDSEELVS